MFRCVAVGFGVGVAWHERVRSGAFATWLVSVVSQIVVLVLHWRWLLTQQLHVVTRTLLELVVVVVVTGATRHNYHRWADCSVYLIVMLSAVVQAVRIQHTHKQQQVALQSGDEGDCCPSL